MKEVKEIIKALRESNVRLSLNNDDLVIESTSGEVSEEIRAAIHLNKDKLVTYFKRNLKDGPVNTIKSVERQGSYQLSSSQRRLWILNQMVDDSVEYCIPGAYLFEGDLDGESFALAFKEVVKRHEILRTVFREIESEEVRQFIYDTEASGFGLLNRTDLRGSEMTDQAIAELVQADLNIPFNLSTGPLIRGYLYHIDTNKWIFAYVLHHIISDAWSMEILMQELLAIYNSYSCGKAPSLPPLPLQYKDYAAWQQEQLKSEEMKQHKEYWLKQMEGELPVLQLPTDRERPAVKTNAGGLLIREIDKELATGIRKLAQEQKATMFMGLLTTVNILLYRYSGQDDFIVGTPVAGRANAELERQIGLYLNTLALRSRFSEDDHFKSLLQTVRKTTLDAYTHQDYPLDELIDAISVKREMSRSTLFDVLVDFHDSKNVKNNQEFGNLEVKGYELGEHLVSKFDLTFMFFATDGGLTLSIEYNKDLYEKETIERLHTHFCTLLEAIVNEPEKPVSRLAYIPAGEIDQLLKAGHNGPVYSSILSLFRKQVAETGNSTAVRFGNTSLTYEELDKHSDKIAWFLEEQCQVKRNDLIGILLDRSEKMIIAVLGALKAGCAYVPVDTGYPAVRQERIIRDAGVKVLLTQTEYAFDLSYYDGRVFAMDVQLDMLDTPPVPPAIDPHPDDLAYVIFTSGSTGQPKGCVITHGNLSNYIQWCDQYYFADPSHGNFGLYTSLSFDLTVTSIFCPLIRGKVLLVYPQETEVPEILSHSFGPESGIDSIKLTPSHVNLLQGMALKSSTMCTVIVGGEEVLPRHVDILKQINPTMKIYNEYGPTETTVGCMVEELKKNSIITIGKPIDGTGIYLLDENMELCSIGVPGHICVGGAGVCQGYLGDGTRTAEKFLPNPYKAGDRLYKTGDIGKRLSDGRIVYAGRKDDQVKIRGYRVELGEVEASLLGFPGVAAAAVIAKQNAEGIKELIAYIVGKDDVTVAALRGYMGKLLPAYMTPAHYVLMEELPLTPNGKVDRRSLPDPFQQKLGTNTGAGRALTRTEEKLIAIWSEILFIDQEHINTKSEFFELGGHSLKVARLASMIYKTFEVKVELRTLFTTTILEEQARFIAESKKMTFSEIMPVEPRGAYDLSASQRRLWILSRFEGGNVAYNVPGSYIFEGELDRGALNQSFRTLIKRHEILRTVFKEDHIGMARQFVLSPEEAPFNISYTDLRAEQEQELRLKYLVEEMFTKPFDLSTGPLLHVSLYQLSENKWLFAYVMHHIISDDWSTGIMIKELLLIYNAFLQGDLNPLPPLRIQYKDYAAWQQQQLKNDTLNVHKNYWKLCFEGEPLTLTIPGDYPRPPVKTYTGGVTKKWLSPSVSKGIRSLTQQQDATLFMGLLAAVNVLMYKYTGLEDIIVGSSIASRQHPDLEDQIGFYVNTLALRSRFKTEDSFEALLENAKQVTIGAYEHQSYPFDELVEQLSLQRDMSRHPLFEVMVVLQRSENGSSAVGGGMGSLQVSKYDGSRYVSSKFDITFFFTESGPESLHLGIVYNSTIYKESTAVRILEHFEQLLEAILDRPGVPIHQLDLLPVAEKEQLREGFNTSSVDYPREKTVVDLFREQAARNPGNTAVVFETKALSYRDLDEQSDRIAGYLRATHDISPNTRVGIMLDRSEKMIVGLLGILKAGAAYVPIDPDQPKARKEHLLRDSEISILVTESQYIFDLDYYEGAVMAIDIQAGETASPIPGGGEAPGPNDLAYIIYTSGSMGHPKGVMIRHRSLVDYVYGLMDRTNVRDCRTFGLMSTLAADLGNTVIYSSLLLGGTLHVFSTACLMDGELMSAMALDCIKIVPSHWKALQGENRLFAPAKSLIFGGEQLTRDVIDDLIRGSAKCEVYNHYGPTETTVGKLLNRIPLKGFDGRVPLGRPFSNTRIYIVDSYIELCPIGITGEICIGGDGLALGYLNSPELTKEKFIEAPFRKDEFIYRTGDLGRWLPDGTIEFAGRKDGQVKIRGYRVEPGEIENALLAHSSINSAVVVSKPGNDGAHLLVAYIVGQDVPGTSELQYFLGNLLPSYMIPVYFIKLDQLPLTSNGKINRKLLPDPDGLSLSGEVPYVAPRDEKEAALITVFEDVLNTRAVGIKHSFFSLGGDSIKAIQIIARLRKLGYVMAIQDVLLNPVIEYLSDHLKLSTREIDQYTVSGLVPLSPIQKYFLAKGSENKSHYNQSVLLYSKDRLDEDGVRAVFGKIVKHHDALRMVYTETVEGWIQENKGEELKYSIEIIKPENEAEYVAHCDRIHGSIDLANGPLLRIGLFHKEGGDYLLIVAHHLVIDGVSWRIIFEDLSKLYNQYVAGEKLELPAKTDSFKYWMEKQVEYSDSRTLRDEEVYWDLVDSTDIKPLPPDFPAGSNLKKDIAIGSLSLSKERTASLLTKSYKAYKTDINDILLTAFSLSIHDSFDADRVLIRLEGHGREGIEEDVDISRTIGWFTTHYPIVLDVKDGSNRIRQLLEIKEYLHRVPGKGMGYGILKYLAGKNYGISPEISFNYLGDFGSGVASGQGTQLFSFSEHYKGREMPDDSTRDTQLNVNCVVVDGTMRLAIEYSGCRYKPETIDRVLNAFRLHLEGLIESLSTEEKVHLSPVDLTYKGLNLEQLEELDRL